MRKILLTFLFAVAGVASSFGEVFDKGNPVYQPSGIFTVYELGNETCAVSFNEPGQDVVIPETIVAHFPENGVDYPKTLSVVQVNSANAKSVTIPANVVTIGPGCFGNDLESITFAKGGTPLQLYPTKYNTKKLSSIEINRDIECVEYSDNKNYSYMPTSAGATCVLKIGADVNTLSGPLFSLDRNGTLPFTKVEFANWAHWYNNTAIDCIEGNPYRTGCPIEAGGFTITNVTIPDDATEIPAYKNAGLKFEGELIFPSTLKKIGAYAFADQKNLYYVEFPEGLEDIADNAFNGCETLTFETLPSTLKAIGQGAFAGCASQKEIILPENLNSLGYGAFNDMAALEKAVLFCDIDSVPGALCANCSNLNTVYLPKKTKVIGEAAFGSVTNLEEIVLPEGLEIICDYAFGRLLDGGDSKLTNVNFPSTLKRIGEKAFFRQNLRSATLNEGLEEIGRSAFAKCPNLHQLTIPSTLTSIPEGAFNGCGIAQVLIPDNITELGSNAFTEVNEDILIAIEVGDGVIDIPSNCFDHPSILKLGSAVKTFAVDAITNYSQLKVFELNSKTPPTVSAAFPLTEEEAESITVIVPDGASASYQRNPRWKIFDLVEQSKANTVVYVNDAPISEEARLQSGIAPSRIVRMKVTGTLADTDWRLIRENFASLISLDLSAITNTKIPNGALAAGKGKSQLVELVLPSKITEIGDNAFEGCSLMDMPSIPDGVTKIGYRAFGDCSMLSISKLPDELVYANGSFSNCTSLRTIVAGDKFMGCESGAAAENVFSGCTSLESVDFSATPMDWISTGMFSGCSNLTTILLPETITEIGEGAFEGTSLEQIQIPAGVKRIGRSAFRGTNLRTVNVPEGVTSIDGRVFANCHRLISVNFPSSLTSIGANVFDGTTTKVTGISCSAIDAPEAQTDALISLSIKRCSLTVPQQSYRSYLNAPQWGRLANLLNRIVVDIPEGIEVTSISEEEYQELVQEEQWEEMAEAEEVEEENVPSRVKARRAARAAIYDGTNFTALFNGAQMATPDERKGTRVFINPMPGITFTGVYYNDIDITAQLEGNSLVLPGKSSGTLRIVGKTSGAEDAVIDVVESATCTAYDTMGRIVYSGDRHDLNSAVSPGVYIVRSGSKVEKILVK